MILNVCAVDPAFVAHDPVGGGAARWGPGLPVDYTTMLARVNGVPDDQIGLAQADCCRFAARGGRFVGGRGRRGPLTWGGAEGI